MSQFDLSRFAINQITTPKWTLAEAIEGYASQGVHGIAVWRQYLDDYGVKAAVKHLHAADMWVASLCTSAWVNQTDAAGYRQALDENRRIIDQAAAIGAPCVVMVMGGVGDDKDLYAQHRRIHDALEELAPYATAAGVKLGLEPLHPMYCGDRSALNLITHANDLIDELGDKASGLVADVYHCWWDPNFEQQLKRAGKDRIVTFHYCDWLVPTRNLRDRGMVGDGVVNFTQIRGWLDEMGYDGPFELEIFSELDWWERDHHETVRIAIERCGPYVGPRITRP
ncbi:sugar phosphate isomerase/epimerase family protein [Pantoea sp. A4]|uniref:sugar phosphate isomerase/epimerase family protein n=1 Tax=Pantoea sp. A4 TaxID=1225184 RepID=UPI00037F70B4|nr:sugar phosphate isomerase/epimerase family protein [Pantoea sp. A4]